MGQYFVGKVARGLVASLAGCLAAPVPGGMQLAMGAFNSANAMQPLANLLRHIRAEGCGILSAVIRPICELGSLGDLSSAEEGTNRVRPAVADYLGA